MRKSLGRSLSGKQTEARRGSIAYQTISVPLSVSKFVFFSSILLENEDDH
ncbi:hypothetical protein P4637_20290 [Halalkalibacterium halodurans]|nr:hypothetical protein [Halalkalibacterium halodurans]MED4087154.1 hypothetical protein [Halalkalibacterium halodurans]MED4107003.1 hypothetical protein [Halalkalibacterium halodurans]MED4110916.1 hypothetical protein [Halalkalibacterium halodurans]MED4150621.1 hypothetical protein [Halalkalibacterium halodurans]